MGILGGRGRSDRRDGASAFGLIGSRQQERLPIKLIRVAIVSDPNAMHGVAGIVVRAAQMTRRQPIMLEVDTPEGTIEIHVEKGTMAHNVNRQLSQWRRASEAGIQAVMG